MIGIGDIMKKIMSDKSFWLILIISIVSLIVLTVGVVFLTRQNAKEFYSAGYIINSTATKSNKYYFNDDTVYEENIFNEYVFKDKDNNEVSASKENFIHYNDNSLSFMKNGVILDLDNFNQNIVPYYNITDKSIVKHNNGSYYIETADKTLVFGNFLGRITDDKYIIVGRDVSVKLAGNNQSVQGDYFEILFVENGIVKIENKDGSYQTLCDGSVIYVGDDIKINLGDKSVVYGDETKLSLSELTIDGNENIDIEPSDGKVKEEDETGSSGGSGGSGSGGSGSGTGEGDGTGDGTGTSDETTGNGSGSGEGTGSGGEDTDIDGETTTILKKEVSINLIQAHASVNSISSVFQIIDTAEAIAGDLTVTLVNTTNPEEVIEPLLLVNDFTEQGIVFDKLLSDCNYVMTITDENKVQYFQKSFRTNSLNLKLNRELVTENSLAYSLDFGGNEEIEQADVSLYDVNDNNREIGRHTIYNVKEEQEPKNFSGLVHNTRYKVVVDNVKISGLGYNDFYSSTTNDWTLKLKPEIGVPTVLADDNNKTFALKLNSVDDPDNAIVSYTYQIYKCAVDEETGVCTDEFVYAFTRTELDEEFLRVSDIPELYSNTDYRYKVTVLYKDNYRYNEIESIYSPIFNVVGAPTIEFKEDVIESDRISGNIIINDVDCTVSYEGRECNPEPNNFIVYYRLEGDNKDTIIDDITPDDIKINNENQTISIHVDKSGLFENKKYIFGLKANVDLKDEIGLRKEYPIGEVIVETTSLSDLEAFWNINGYSFENPISVNTRLEAMNEDNESINKLASITYELYTGKTLIATYTLTKDNENFDKLLSKDGFSLNSSLFEYKDAETSEIKKIDNLDVLKELSGGELLEKYTIKVTDAYAEGYVNDFDIEPTSSVYVYNTPAILLLENTVEVSVPSVIEITNGDLKSGDHPSGIEYDANLEPDSDIIRGYQVTAVFSKHEIQKYAPISKINFYVYDMNGTPIETKFIDFSEEEEYTVYFEVGRGTDLEVDTTLTRGNAYTFAYDLTVVENGKDVIFPSSKPTSEEKVPLKMEPEFKLYVDNSTKDSITYKYSLKDYDKALSKEEDKYYIYYTVNNGEVFTSEYKNDGSNNTFTLSNLENKSIYSLGYYRTVSKKEGPSYKDIGKYFFDGYYSANDYGIGYELKYGNFDNRLQILINDNELLDRVSAYLVTLSTSDDKYQKVISDLSLCDTSDPEVKDKCIVIDYKDIASFKGKNIKVTLEAFYDTGYVGFGQKSLLNNYFKNIGLADENSSNIGFVYQTTGVEEAGKYFYVTSNGFSALNDYPRGILAFELVPTDVFGETWKLNTSNMIDDKEGKLVPFGTISKNDANVMVVTGGKINIIKKDIVSVNPKVLDVVSMPAKDDKDTFKFTSIIPKVTTTVTPLINGAKMHVTLSDDYTESNYIAGKDGKYKFYIDVYKKHDCSNLAEGEECPTDLVYARDPVLFETDNLSEFIEKGLDVTFQGVEPDTTYIYKISADMNKNGEPFNTPLFDNNKSGYLEFKQEFSTLGKSGVLNRVEYKYDSNITEDVYNERILEFKTLLKNKTNLDIKYVLKDIDGNVEFSHIISNEDILSTNGNSEYKIKVADIEKATGKEFVFGPGYHTLVVSAVTTDLNKELILYDDVLGFDGAYKKFKELEMPTFKFTKTTPGYIFDEDNNKNFNLSFEIAITDVDKVAKDGKFYIELKDGMYNSLCPGHEQDCVVTVNIEKKNGKLDYSISKADSLNVESYDVKLGDDVYLIKIKYTDLLPETKYSIHVSADTYRNNYGLSEKEKTISVPYEQYTQSDIKFSLGDVTPTVLTNNKLLITFAGAANLNQYLVGMEYTIFATGQGPLGGQGHLLGANDKGVVGPNKLDLRVDANFYPTQTIELKNGAVFTEKVVNTIYITYYYKDDNGVVTKFGGDNEFSYSFKWEIEK